MRGALLDELVDFIDGGIIPAYAGSTGEASGSAADGGDHPRVCGEHSSHLVLASIHLGSSPRMRGAPLQVTF